MKLLQTATSFCFFLVSVVAVNDPGVDELGGWNCSIIGPGWTSFMPHIGDVVVEKLHDVDNPTFTVAAETGQCVGVVTDDPIAIDLCNHVRVSADVRALS